MRSATAVLGCASLLLLAGAGRPSRADELTVPRIITVDGRHTLLVDGEPFFILGGQSHNSSAWPGRLPRVWAAIEALHANTLEIPIYWQQIEPEEGEFDFTVVDTIIRQAREHEVRLVLLWFATWKNNAADYTPNWVKLNPKKYPYIEGSDGKTIVSLSPHAEATMEADANAFAAVMRHLKEFDPQHTVIMVQVENNAGCYGSPRDFSEDAERLFQSAVPRELLNADVLAALNKPINARGNWEEVFGADADEFFQAWAVARYINFVAEAGKAEYPLPMYVNAPLEGELGGATYHALPIYKAAAPAIDVLAPSLYQSGEKAEMFMTYYDRTDNALFVPETFQSVDYLYEVIRREGIGFAPFGVDGRWRSPGSDAAGGSPRSPLATQYAMLRLADREFARWIFEARLQVIEVSEEESEQGVDLGRWRATVSFGARRRWGSTRVSLPDQESGAGAGREMGAPPKPSGRAVIAQLGESEFVVMATQCRITFEPSGDNEGKAWQFLKVEEGRYVEGEFQLSRLRNGDEAGWGMVSVGAEPVLLRVTMTAW